MTLDDGQIKRQLHSALSTAGADVEDISDFIGRGSISRASDEFLEESHFFSFLFLPFCASTWDVCFTGKREKTFFFCDNFIVPGGFKSSSSFPVLCIPPAFEMADGSTLLVEPRHGAFILN